MKLVIAVDGVAPGIGKSTLASELARVLSAQSMAVTHFREEDVLTHPACRSLAEQFRATDRVEPDTCLEAARAYLRQLDASDFSVAVVDALLPFVGSLLASGYTDSDIDVFMYHLRRATAHAHVVLVLLDGDPGESLGRASAREGEGWLAWLIGRFRGVAGDEIVDLETLSAFFRRRRELTLRLLRVHPWHVGAASDDSSYLRSTRLRWNNADPGVSRGRHGLC